MSGTRDTMFKGVAEYWKEIAKLRWERGDKEGARQAEEQAAKTLAGAKKLNDIEHLTHTVMTYKPKTFEHLCQFMEKKPVNVLQAIRKLERSSRVGINVYGKRYIRESILDRIPKREEVLRAKKRRKKPP